MLQLVNDLELLGNKVSNDAGRSERIFDNNLIKTKNAEQACGQKILILGKRHINGSLLP